MKINLADLPLGKEAIIKEFTTGKIIEERLHSLGLVNGAKITAVRSLPLGGSRTYLCLNAQMAIRNDDAKLIEVEYD